MDVLSLVRPPGTRLALRRFAGTQAFVDVFGRPLRVAHITDQHVGRLTPIALQREAIRQVKEQQADFVVLTGDFVAHSLDYLDLLEELLGGLDVPAFAVLGNHDHWSGPNEVRRVLHRVGIEVLDNAHTVATIAGQRIQIVGVDDAYTGHADVARATVGLRRDLPTLGLSHVGETADALWQAGASLVLSGHTHSGQVTWGGLNEVLLGRMGGHRYVHGLYGDRRLERTLGALYVSAGIGSSMFGLRLGERGRPEVAMFDLGVAPGGFTEPLAEQQALPGRAEPAGRTEKRHADALKKQKKRLERHEARTSKSSQAG